MESAVCLSISLIELKVGGENLWHSIAKFLQKKKNRRKNIEI